VLAPTWRVKPGVRQGPGHGPIPPEEDDLIVPLVRARLLLEVLRAPYDRQPQWNRQMASLRAYTTLRATAG
jgi:hypothetical protein